MKIAHVIQSIAPVRGGPPAVVANLCREQALQGAEVRIVTAAAPDNARWMGQWRDWCELPERVQLQEVPGRRWRDKERRTAEFQLLASTVDALHAHEMWTPLVWSALCVERGARPAVLLSPHCQLGPWALAQKPLKKSLALALGWRRRLQAVSVLHALNDAERADLRDLLPEARIEIMPNGVALAPVDTLAHPASNAPVVLFMARLHVMKGADTLLEAFALALQRRMIGDDTRLVLAGPDFGLLDALRRRAGALQVGHRVEFPGAVYGADKARLLRNATVFCQPSRHEGFSLSILEALAAGLPVLTTPEANFPEVQSRGCGLICPRDAPSLAAGLAALLGDPARRVAMGQAGRALVASDYTWSGVAQRSFALYAAAMEA